MNKQSSDRRMRDGEEERRVTIATNQVSKLTDQNQMDNINFNVNSSSNHHHNNNNNNNNNNELGHEVTSSLREIDGDSRINQIAPNSSSSSSPLSSSLKPANNKTPLDASIRLIETKHRKLRALRQINIVGRLNHSANRGILFVMANSIALLMTLSALLVLLLAASSGEAALPWPFNGTNHHHQLPSISPLHFVNSTSSSVGSRLAHWPQQVLNKSRRVTRNSGAKLQSSGGETPSQTAASSSSSASSTMPQQPPISQQFHYFWNHDQIEPKTMATEAQRILADAQLQTDKIAIESLVASNRSSSGASGDDEASPPVNGSASGLSRQDTLVAAASSAHLDQLQPGAAMMAPPPPQGPMGLPTVDQQLTSMVLQMQRQQQVSMMMQPRLEAARRVAAATAAAVAATQAVNAAAAAASSPAFQNTPINPMSRYWMSDSNQHPVVALPPQSPHSLASPSEPMQMAMSGVSPYSMAAAAASSASMPRVASPSSSIGGVPVYGPFVVAPTMAQQALQQASAAMSMPRPHQHSMQMRLNGQQGMQMQKPVVVKSAGPSTGGSPTSRFASSLLSRRKSWPFFGIGGSSESTKNSGMQAASSQVRPTILSPPNLRSAASSQIAQASQPLELELPPETVALLDLASKQLASAIAGHIQDGAARRNLAAVLAQSIGGISGQPADDLNSAASMTYASHHQMGRPDQSFSLSHRNFGNHHNLQPPYSLATNLFDPSSQFSHINLMGHSAMQPLPPVNQPFEHYQQPSQHFDLPAMLSMGNSSGVPFGSRLKRRHLSPYNHQSVGDNPRHEVSAQSLRASVMPRPPYSLMSGGSESNIVKSVDKSSSSPIKSIRNNQRFEPTIEEYYGTDSYPQIHITQSSGPNKLSSFDEFDNHDSMPASGSKAINRQVKSGGHEIMRRVVKKDKPSQFDAISKQSQASKAKSSDLRHLFMLVTTESPIYSTSESNFGSTDEPNGSDLFEVVDNREEQTQLRRLKRSARTSRSLGSSFGSSSWKSMESTTSLTDSPAPVFEDYSKKIIPLKSITSGASSSWSPSGSSWVGTGSGMAIGKRLAEITTGTRVADINKTVIEQEHSPLKVKKVTASASVIHSPASRLHSTGAKLPAGGSSRSFTPMPTETPTQPEQAAQASSDSQDSQVDPMAASLSESARVVNYFQNVENEPSSTTARPQIAQPQASYTQQQVAQQQASPSPQPASQQSPQLNVGFSAPTKLIPSRVQSESSRADLAQESQATADIKRRNQGNGQRAQLAPSTQQSSGGSRGASSGSGQKSRQQQADQHHQPQTQSPAAAPNADISSAATSYTNNMSAALPASHSTSQLSANSLEPAKQQVASDGQRSYRTAIMNFFDKQVGGQPIVQQQQLRAGSQSLSPMMTQAQGPNSGEFNLQKALISSLLEMSNAKRRSSTMQQNGFMMPKQSQYSGQLGSLPPTSGNMSYAPNQRAQGFERSVAAADQSNAFNEEVAPPQTLTRTQSAMDSASFNTGNQYESTLAQSHQDLGLQSDQLPAAIDAINQSPAQGDLGSGDATFGSRNNLSGLDVTSGLNSNQEQQLVELNRFNQQQEQAASPSNLPYQPNQTSDLTSSAEPITFNSQQQVLSASELPSVAQNQLGGLQPQASSEPSQLASSALHPPIMGTVQQQQQIYSQQLQALSAAVNGINQQALNQQQQQQSMPFEEQQMLQQQHRQFIMNQHQQPSGIQRNFYSPQVAASYPGGIDEEAAANVAAAAGIPSFPSTAQLLALQSQGHNLGDLNGMLMAGSEKRESEGDGESTDSPKKSKGKGKKGKGGGYKQVSHHYHFNSLMSPFEDGALDQSMGAPFNPLDIAGNLQQAEFKAAKQRAKANKQREQEEEERAKQKQQEELEEKPKKKGFLRRFSIKNLFKRFRKDKSKGQQQQQQQQEDDSGNDERGQDEKSNSSSQGDSSDERSAYDRR